MPNTVFIDPELEKEFNLKGYVIVPFLSSEEVEALKDKFFETIEESGGPKTSGNVDFDSKEDISYDFTFIDKNVEYKKRVYDIITEKFQAKADTYLNHYTPIIANYIRKKEGGGEVPMHQNWAFVDERKFTSVSIWVPLVDSNEDNGTLQIVAGSHKRFGEHRGPMVPWELRNVKEDIIARHLTPMNVKAGQGVILDDSVVHYSNVNKTPGLRLAIQLIMIPEEATSLHYHLDRDKNQSKIEVLETNVEFFTNFHPWLKPKGMPVIGTIDFVERNYSYSDFLKGMEAARFDSEEITKDRQGAQIPPLFTDKETQAKFDRDGYVKIPLLGKDEVEQLKGYYESLQHEHIGDYGFHVSLDSKNAAYIDGVFDRLFSTIMPKLNPLLKDFKAFTASYVIKEAGLQNIVPPHQDWTFVDEDKFCSATVWIPLMDVNKNNGALGVIKGSHKLFSYPRVSPSPQAKSILSDHFFTLFPYVEVIEMKAGEALIFNNKTIHASPSNISGSARIGAGIGITQKNAQLLHYYQLPGADDIDIYKVDETFFKKYNNSRLSEIYDNGQKPLGLAKAGSIKKSAPVYSKEEIIQLVCSTQGVAENPDLLKSLSSLHRPDTKAASHQPEQQQVVANDTKSGKATAVPMESKSFFEIYTPSNILAEIKHRLAKR